MVREEMVEGEILREGVKRVESGEEWEGGGGG